MHIDANPDWRAEPPGWGFAHLGEQRYRWGRTTRRTVALCRRDVGDESFVIQITIRAGRRNI